jgi:hypothetical protein
VVAAFVIVVAGAWGILRAASDATEPGFETRQFNRQIWLMHRGAYESPRGQLVDDLLRQHLKIGMTKRQVVRLLGPPDEKFPPISPEEDPAVVEDTFGYGYYAGPHYDCIFQLVDVEFDKRWIVTKVWLHRPKDICTG